MSSPDSNADLVARDRLNKETLENILVSEMFKGLLTRTESLDKYSSWLTAGTGAGLVLLLTNLQEIAPVVSPGAIRTSLGLLAISLGCGAIAKFFSMQCQTSNYSGSDMDSVIDKAMTNFHAEQEKIDTAAEARGLSLDTNLNFTSILLKYLRPFPRIYRWLVTRFLAKHLSDPHISFLLPLRFFRWQGFFLTCQVISVIVAVVVASWNAKAA